MKFVRGDLRWPDPKHGHHSCLGGCAFQMLGQQLLKSMTLPPCSTPLSLCAHQAASWPLPVSHSLFSTGKGIKVQRINCITSKWCLLSRYWASWLWAWCDLKWLTWTSYRDTSLQGKVTKSDTSLRKTMTVKTTAHSVQKSTDPPDLNITTKAARAPSEASLLSWQGKRCTMQSYSVFWSKNTEDGSMDNYYSSKGTYYPR